MPIGTPIPAPIAELAVWPHKVVWRGGVKYVSHGITRAQVFRSAITKVGRADEDTTLYSTDFAALSTLQKEVGELEGGVSTNQFKARLSPRRSGPSARDMFCISIAIPFNPCFGYR